MSSKEKYLCLFLGVASIFLLGLTFFNDKIDFNNLLKASVAESSLENNEVIEAARKMAEKNINEINGEVVYTIKDLVRNKYLTGNEIDPVTNEEYKEDTRVIVKVNNKKIEDIYISNILFKNKYNCKEVCYLDFDNYVYFNNNTYRILKIDGQGYIYITNQKIKKTSKDNIDFYLKNLKNSFTNSMVSNVTSLTDKDIEKSNMIELQDNVVVNTTSGYKIYNIDNNSVSEISENKVTIYPVIVLKNNLIYEKGDGTKFDPFVIVE